MGVIKGVGCTPFVSKISLHFTTFTREEKTVKDKDFQNISLKEICLSTVFTTDFKVHDGFIGVSKEIHLGLIRILTTNKHIKTAGTNQSGRVYRFLFFRSTGYHKYINGSPRTSQGGGRVEVVINTIKPHGTTGADLICLVCWTGGG